ncbi:MAG: FAD-dependent oxidoreductase, partial [Duncaniella sp.]|nr:FAD-dependent oxidoreductase [Duncaniella sp.]
MTRQYDYLVIGSGIAGMSFALKVARHGRVALICKTTLDEANTALAQGGVASVTNLEVDDFDKHIHDTMVAGDWLSDPAAVELVVKNAPAQIRELINWGVDFDRNDKGDFDLHREGGHSEFRRLHQAANTGDEIQQSLIEAVRKGDNIDICEHHFA